MKKLFEDKVFLVLGSNVGSDDIVQYARENGAYTIVADYYPPERSSAKRIADEGVLISTADLDALGELIKERHVDGVFAGVSEFNLLKAMELANNFNLPFYCSREQWDSIENKAMFRKLCKECGVPTPKTYFKGEKISNDILRKINYPAIIKPVDSSSSSGVHICLDEHEILDFQKDALSKSSCREIIIEEFVKGKEFTAHYSISNGVPTFSCMDNRYPIAVHEGNVTTVPAARIYPSIFIDEYLKQVNQPMLRLCRSIGLRDAVLFIQGMYDQKEGFHIFEGGLRTAGEAPYRFLDKINGVNFMHILVDHALLGQSVSFESEMEDPFVKGKCPGVVSFVSKGGTVGAIEGLNDAVANIPSVIDYECRYPVGSVTPNGDTLHQIMIRFVMICDSREQMVKDIAYLNNNITVLNDKGENMVAKINPQIIMGA